MNRLALLGIEENDVKKFEGYMEDILKLNESINLTAITEKAEFVEKHYLDSIVIRRYDEMKEATRVLDLGTGAGFPGVPLAILFPEKEFVLVDSLNKRLKIIQELCEKHGIENVKVVHGRAEELGRNPEYREKFDLCLSRAVASLPVLTEYCLPFVKVGGSLVAYKGPDAEEEIKRAKNAINKLGGKFDRVENAGIEDLSHNLVFIKKIKNTDKRFPRKPGTPSKEPL